MALPFRDIPKEPGVIRTTTYQDLKSALSDGVSPILLSGPAGSGKTTTLHLILQDWISQHKLVVFIELRQVFRQEDLFTAVREGLRDAVGPSAFGEATVIGSSGRETLEVTLRLVRTLPDNLLILLDGLDETPNQDMVLRFVRLLSESSRALFVISTRSGPETVESGLFKRRIFVTPLSMEDVIKWVSEFFPGSVDLSVVQDIFHRSGGSPLYIRLFLDSLSEQSRLSVKDLIPGTDAAPAIPISLQGMNDEARTVLSVLAILGRPMTVSEIAGLGLNDPNQLPLPLIRRAGDTLSLAHEWLAELIIQVAGLLPAQGASLRDLQFGAEEAERDDLLAKSFIRLPGFSELLSGSENIVIGDRGTGKSAMFSQLVSQNQQPAKGSNTHRVIPVTHPADMLNKLEANGSQLRTADQLRAGWLTIAAYCLTATMESFSSRKYKRAAAHLREMLGEDDKRSHSFTRFLRETFERVLVV